MSDRLPVLPNGYRLQPFAGDGIAVLDADGCEVAWLHHTDGEWRLDIQLSVRDQYSALVIVAAALRAREQTGQEQPQ